ncbi:RagB/SusD family nutrient uptake outer membrane protein [Rhabdobacter roseus]|uniref:RagB/SusD family nutrient uptake outer membrane protein n=1 Tax=Rhabdobacter roseus TaxID=1655419 RepID=A0A840U0Y0_9BACT|nr:RagB/SusD family nutrient uptake outer membrane protein [Rhabdobacter roseus]MBB5287233.1 hypothetical protein [Rhabdobacter roseus]
MKIKTIFCTILSLFTLSSCQEDFLGLAPQTERNTQNFYRTAADFNNAVVGNYAALKLSGVYGSGLIWVGEISTDNTMYGITRQSGNVDNFQFIDHTYTTLNSIIYGVWRDHYIGISRANAILTRIENADIPAAQKAQYTGEAQFLRALFYFDLVRLFGAVPLVVQEITNPYGASNLTRTPVEEVYQLILSDLQGAEQNLPAQYPATNVGRATRGAAKALLGKVYLTRKEWTSAANKLKEVIDLNQYRLLPEYASAFSFASPTNDETLFNVQYRSGNTGQGSSFWASFTPWSVGSLILGPNGGTGGGLNMPTRDMVNAYETGDKRLAFSIQQSYTSASGAIVQEPFVTKYKQMGALPNDSDVDFPVLRYADVLLMYAEALNEISFSPEAVTRLNQVRARAGLEPTTANSQAAFRLAIEQERRVELAFENHRWFDLIRTDRYLPVMRAKGYNVQDHHVLYLIPQLEIDLNASLQQNPGY